MTASLSLSLSSFPYLFLPSFPTRAPTFLRFFSLCFLFLSHYFPLLFQIAYFRVSFLSSTFPSPFFCLLFSAPCSLFLFSFSRPYFFLFLMIFTRHAFPRAALGRFQAGKQADAGQRTRSPLSPGMRGRLQSFLLASIREINDF